jgi:hypothetical protein
MIVPAASRALGNALVTDLVPRDSLDRGLALFSAADWIAGIVGFAGAGQAFALLGMNTALVVAASLPLVSVLLLIPVRQPARQQEALEGG